jgi:membrane protease YdiL (CAAX protease family)
MDAPPVLSVPPLIPQPPARRGAWIVLLVLMLAYIGYATVRGGTEADSGPALAGTIGPLWTQTLLNLAVFAIPLGIGLAFARATREDLRMVHHPGFLAWVLGFLWSILLRIAVAVPLVGVTVALQFIEGSNALERVKGLRPKLENLLPVEALGDPVYALVCMTWVSFVVAGFREELWRAVTLRGFRALFPQSWSARSTEWVALVLSSAAFGLAHLTQGWGAVALTSILGLGLGWIQVWRRSLWEAVIAHGFFDASTFLILFLLHNPTVLKLLHLPPDVARQLFKG